MLIHKKKLFKYYITGITKNFLLFDRSLNASKKIIRSLDS